MSVLTDTNAMMEQLKQPFDSSWQTNLPADVMKKIERRANGFARQRSASNPMNRYGSVDSTSLYQPFLNPLIDRQHLEFPKDRVKSNQRYWDYFLTDPIFATGIRLLVEFPLSDFRICHPDPAIEDLFNEMAERLDLLSLILNMGIQYYVIGEAIPFGFVDDVKNPKMWTDFILLNPDWATLHRHPAVRPRACGMFGKYSVIYEFHRDPGLRKIVERGPKDPLTSDLYKQLPSDILNSVKKQIGIKLPDLQTSYFQRVGNYFWGRGESVVKSALFDMMYRDKLREAQYAIADRHVSPTEFYFIGEQGQPATQPELAAFDDAMQSIWGGANHALIWHHACRVQWEGANGRILPLIPEFQNITQRQLAAMGISEALFWGTGPTFSNASVSLEVLIARFLTFRQSLEQFLIKQVFAPICLWNGFFKKEDAESKDDSRFRILRKTKPLDLPTIKWDKENLRQDREKINMLANFAGQGILPYEYLWLALNLDPKVVMKKLKEQAIDLPSAQNMMKAEQPGSLPGEVQPGAGLGTPNLGIGGEEMQEGPGLDIVGAEGAPAQEIIPPEAHQEQGLPTTV